MKNIFKNKKVLTAALSFSLLITSALGTTGLVYASDLPAIDDSNEPLVIAPAPINSQLQDTSNQTSLTATAKTSSQTATKAASKKKNPTAKQVLKSLKKSLGKSYTSDTKETKKRLEDYYGLNMKKVVSWAAETNSNSALQSDTAIILKVKKGYAKTAAKKLQTAYEQVVSYNRMYNMDLQRVLQARLYVDGNYVALIIEGQKPDCNLSAEKQAKFAKSEAKKIDKAWKKIFGSAKNKIKIPKDDTNKNYFGMAEGLGAGK